MVSAIGAVATVRGVAETAVLGEPAPPALIALTRKNTGDPLASAPTMYEVSEEPVFALTTNQLVPSSDFSTL